MPRKRTLEPEAVQSRRRVPVRSLAMLRVTGAHKVINGLGDRGTTT